MRLSKTEQVAIGVVGWVTHAQSVSRVTYVGWLGIMNYRIGAAFRGKP